MQVPVAIWVICHPHFLQDRFFGAHPISQLMLCGSAGFFLHDAVSCLIRESPFYVVHGLTCCLGYTAGAYFGFGHFYGGLFLLWEISTPFVQLRWILYKMGATETAAYVANGLLMVFSFGMVRVVFGTCASPCSQLHACFNQKPCHSLSACRTILAHPSQALHAPSRSETDAQSGAGAFV